MRKNRHCQIYLQILNPEKNVMRSTLTVLQVKGHKSPLLLGETLGLRCRWTRTGQCTTNADTVWTVDRSCWCDADNGHKLCVRAISSLHVCSTWASIDWLLDDTKPDSFFLS